MFRGQKKRFVRGAGRKNGSIPDRIFFFFGGARRSSLIIRPPRKNLYCRRQGRGRSKDKPQFETSPFSGLRQPIFVGAFLHRRSIRGTGNIHAPPADPRDCGRRQFSSVMFKNSGGRHISKPMQWLSLGSSDSCSARARAKSLTQKAPALFDCGLLKGPAIVAHFAVRRGW